MGVLETFTLDTCNGECKVNGKDISNSAHYLSLEFKDGEWSLTIAMNEHYYQRPAITRGEISK